MKSLKEREPLSIVIIDDEMGKGVKHALMLKVLEKIGVNRDRIYIYLGSKDFFLEEQQQALARLMRKVYFVDYHLEGESGTDIIYEIRRREKKSNGVGSYILGWSSDETQERRMDFAESGANQVVEKQIVRERFEATLHAAADFYDTEQAFQRLSLISTSSSDPGSPMLTSSTRSSDEFSPDLGCQRLHSVDSMTRGACALFTKPSNSKGTVLEFLGGAFSKKC